MSIPATECEAIERLLQASLDDAGEWTLPARRAALLAASERARGLHGLSRDGWALVVGLRAGDYAAAVANVRWPDRLDAQVLRRMYLAGVPAEVLVGL